jgi:NTE family protein
VNPGTRYTLVLGGGGMKGLAHVGVLEALLERGLKPTHIVGCSVGSMVGAAWASGKSIPELKDIAINLKRKDVFQIAHADMAFKRMRSPALFRREPLAQLIARLVGDVRFQDLDVPVIMNTVDINSGMQVLWGLPGLDDIPVADAVFASCALPGYLPPHEIRGRFYVDGATLDNLPVAAGRAMDGELIFAADVSASSTLRGDTQEEGFAAVFGRATEIAMQSVLEVRLRHWSTPPVFYIHPRVEHISMFNFDNLREVVEEGYRATIEALNRPASWPQLGDDGVYPKRRVLVHVEPDRCIGCGACLFQGPPGLFVLDNDRKAVVTQPEQEWSPGGGAFIRHCPTYAISARPILDTAEMRKSG